MSESSSDQLLEHAVALLRNPTEGSLDEILDSLVRIALTEGRLECLGHDGLHFTLGSGRCHTFDFGDSVGRFRAILARFHFRAKALPSSHIAGSVYGSEIDMTFDLLSEEPIRVKPQINNTQALPHLAISKIGAAHDS